MQDRIVEYLRDYPGGLVSTTELSRVMGERPLRICNAVRRLIDRRIVEADQEVTSGGAPMMVRLLPDVGVGGDPHDPGRHRRMAAQLARKGML